MQFSQRLKELRVEKGVSQSELAEKIYVSRSAVAKWENGLGLPCAQSLELIAEYFGVSYDSLLSDSPSEEIIVNKNVTISRSKKIIIAVGTVCLVALAVIIFLLVYFTSRSSSKPNGGVDDPFGDYSVGDTVAKVVGIYGEILDENYRDTDIVNNDIAYSNNYRAYKLEIGKEYLFHVNPRLIGGSTPVAFTASGITLEYDKDLFDISLRYPDYSSDEQRSEYILKVKRECNLAAIVISASGKDDNGNPMNSIVLISAQ